MFYQKGQLSLPIQAMLNSFLRLRFNYMEKIQLNLRKLDQPTNTSQLGDKYDVISLIEILTNISYRSILFTMLL